MKYFLAILLLSPLGVGARELDDEARVTNHEIRMSADLPATVVVRENRATGDIQVLETREALRSDPVAVRTLENRRFTAVEPHKAIRGELDRDTSRSSWYFYLNSYPGPYGFNPGYNPYYGGMPNYYPSNFYGGMPNYFPQYYYGGYTFNYQPYFSYNYGPYSYCFYRWWW